MFVIFEFHNDQATPDSQIEPSLGGHEWPKKESAIELSGAANAILKEEEDVVVVGGMCGVYV